MAKPTKPTLNVPSPTDAADIRNITSDLEALNTFTDETLEYLETEKLEKGAVSVDYDTAKKIEDKIKNDTEQIENLFGKFLNFSGDKFKSIQFNINSSQTISLSDHYETFIGTYRIVLFHIGFSTGTSIYYVPIGGYSGENVDIVADDILTTQTVNVVKYNPANGVVEISSDSTKYVTITKIG